MKFLADEGVDKKIVLSLRDAQYDVTYIAEFSAGIDDETVLQISNEEDRILITRDKDFGELVYREQKVHSGIVLNRLAGLKSATKAELVLKVIEQYGEELYQSFTVIQAGVVRIRRLK